MEEFHITTAPSQATPAGDKGMFERNVGMGDKPTDAGAFKIRMGGVSGVFSSPATRNARSVRTGSSSSSGGGTTGSIGSSASAAAGGSAG